jgi:ketosteroid isomerase-like protein
VRLLGPAVLSVIAICACTSPYLGPTRSAEAEFATFLDGTWRAAQEAFINGDAAEWKANASQGPDATIFGGFGGFEKGWEDVGKRYDWAAAQFHGSGAEKRVEYLSTGASGDLAFTVAIERNAASTVAPDTTGDLVLRVTQIFRRENGAWKLLHRHADPMLEKKAPSS